MRLYATLNSSEESLGATRVRLQVSMIPERFVTKVKPEDPINLVSEALGYRSERHWSASYPPHELGRSRPRMTKMFIQSTWCSSRREQTVFVAVIAIIFQALGCLAPRVSWASDAEGGRAAEPNREVSGNERESDNEALISSEEGEQPPEVDDGDHDATTMGESVVRVEGDDEAQFPADASREQSSITGVLVVDVDPSIADRELYPSWIKQRNPDLEERLPDSLGARPWIAVEISGTTYDYHVAIMPIQDELSFSSGEVRFSCECSSEALLDAIDEGIAKAVHSLRQRATDRQPDDKPNEEVDTLPRDDSQEEEADVRRGLGRLGYAGLAIGLVGGGMIGGGVALIVTGPYDVDYREGEMKPYILEATMPGVGLIAGGGAALVGGIVMLAVDARSRRGAHLALAPEVDGRRVGVVLAGRF